MINKTSKQTNKYTHKIHLIFKQSLHHWANNQKENKQTDTSLSNVMTIKQTNRQTKDKKDKQTYWNAVKCFIIKCKEKQSNKQINKQKTNPETNRQIEKHKILLLLNE